MRLNALIVAAALLMGGCSTLTDMGVVRKEGLRDDQGYLVGYKQLLRNRATGEVIAQVQMFTPIHDANGELMGFEEQTKDGAIIRDLTGRPIGTRFSDLRSRSTNARSKGITIVFRPADATRMAVSEPKLFDLMASLSASDLRRIQ
jgi:hypothetical protein